MKTFYIVGGYKGMTEKYNKRITPYFNSYQKALHYKQCYKYSSLSLAEGIIKEKIN